jgi:hypothetical protein
LTTQVGNILDLETKLLMNWKRMTRIQLEKKASLYEVQGYA